MAVEVHNKKENILLSRTEVEATITFDKKPTPSNVEVAKLIAKEVGSDDSLIVVKNIYTTYGTNSAKVSAYQYISKDELLKHEPQAAKAAAEAAKKAEEEAKKKAEEEAAKKEEEKAAEKPAEDAPKEEKSEEPKEEVKKEEPKEEKAEAEKPKEEPKAEEKKEESKE